MAANRGADQESFRDLGSARVIFAPIGNVTVVMLKRKFQRRILSRSCWLPELLSS